MFPLRKHLEKQRTAEKSVSVSVQLLNGVGAWRMRSVVL